METFIDVNRRYNYAASGEIGPSGSTVASDIFGIAFNSDRRWVLDVREIKLTPLQTQYGPGAAPVEVALVQGYSGGGTPTAGSSGYLSWVNREEELPAFSGVSEQRPLYAVDFQWWFGNTDGGSQAAAEVEAERWRGYLDLARPTVIRDPGAIAEWVDGVADGEPQWVALRTTDGDPGTGLDVLVELSFDLETFK